MVSISEEYNRKNFLFFLKEFLPEDFIEKNEEYKLEKNNSYFKNAFLIGSVDSLKELAIFEIQRINPEKSRNISPKTNDKVIIILKLEGNKYYVGKTTNPQFRLENHFHIFK